MRKLLVLILILLALTVLWLWRGRDVAPLVDQFETVRTRSEQFNSISYQGSGTGGVLRAGEVDLDLDEAVFSGAKPNVGTSTDGQLALSFRGKLFQFGPTKSENEQLSANVPSGDIATLSVEHGVLPWPNFFEVNFMTGNSPKWKRYIYRKLTWKKANGAKLEMLWRYEQFFYRNDGWVDGFMIRPPATGLIRVEISALSR